MAVDHASYERLLQYKIPEVEHTLTTRDRMLSAPVYPGETLRTEMWKNGNVVSFRCKVVARDSVVLNNGRAEIA